MSKPAANTNKFTLISDIVKCYYEKNCEQSNIFLGLISMLANIPEMFEELTEKNKDTLRVLLLVLRMELGSVRAEIVRSIFENAGCIRLTKIELLKVMPNIDLCYADNSIQEPYYLSYRKYMNTAILLSRMANMQKINIFEYADDA